MSRTQHFLDCGCNNCVNQLLADIEKMEEAIKAALRISDVWVLPILPGGDVFKDEAIAVLKMKERFEKAIK